MALRAVEDLGAGCPRMEKTGTTGAEGNYSRRSENTSTAGQDLVRDHRGLSRANLQDFALDVIQRLALDTTGGYAS